jgi:hypothetical protein
MATNIRVTSLPLAPTMSPNIDFLSDTSFTSRAIN